MRFTKALATPPMDYPRRCGEHLVLTESICPANLLPPQVRGTSAKVLTPCPLPGSTPANAGSILLFCSKCQHLSTNSVCKSQQEHPRTCGEHAKILYPISTFFNLYVRSTPTNAGNSILCKCVYTAGVFDFS